MIQMGEAWAHLADQAVKNSRTDIVYEAQPRRPRGPEAGN